MPQNIYDDPTFFDGYSKLPRSREGLAAAPEWPTVLAMLPNLKGKNVLDLGCGFGAFARWSAKQGASSIVAIDLSENMLASARQQTKNNCIDFRKGDVANLNVAETEFNLVYSALVFHYIEDFPSLCRVIRNKLADGGRLVASVEHPIFTAPSNPAWREDEHNEAIWPLDGYLMEGERRTNWFADDVVKYHRTVESYVNTLLDCGFVLRRIVEWGPSESQLSEHPEWSQEVHRPPFLLISADAAR